MLPFYVRLGGYYCVKTEERYITRLQNLLFVLKVRSYPNEKGGIFIPAKEKERLLSAAKKEHLSLTIGEICGLPRRLQAQKHRLGVPLGIIFAFLILWFGTHTVWRVDVSGNENVLDHEIVTELSALGFGVGSNTKIENRNELVASYLLAHPEIAWMSIYTEGTTAHVRVIEKKEGEIPDTLTHPSHLIAAKDAIIVRLDITHGTAVVKLGNTVKKGDVLALGLVSGAHQDTLLAAEGEVIGRVCEEFAIEIPYKQTEKVEKMRKTIGLDFIFFEKTINIFKKTSKNPMDYVIIERKEGLTLFGKIPLPWGYTVKEIIFYREEDRILDKGEAILEAVSRLEEQIRTAVGEGELLSRSVRVEEKENACVLHATIEYTQNIARRLPFTVS